MFEHWIRLKLQELRDGAVSAAYAIHRICFLFTIYYYVEFCRQGLVSSGRKFRDESITILGGLFPVRLILIFGE